MMRRHCLTPGCHEFADPGKSYCAAHRAQKQRRLDVERGSPAARGYDSQWAKFSKAILERDGHTCGWCGRPATTTDHVIPLAHGGARLDPTNAVAACRACNSRRGGSTRRPS
jgi:5-methylcytosine-specific restriction endonuclease McrA